LRLIIQLVITSMHRHPISTFPGLALSRGSERDAKIVPS